MFLFILWGQMWGFVNTTSKFHQIFISYVSLYFVRKNVRIIHHDVKILFYFVMKIVLHKSVKFVMSEFAVFSLIFWWTFWPFWNWLKLYPTPLRIIMLTKVFSHIFVFCEEICKNYFLKANFVSPFRLCNTVSSMLARRLEKSKKNQCLFAWVLSKACYGTIGGYSSFHFHSSLWNERPSNMNVTPLSNCSGKNCY